MSEFNAAAQDLGDEGGSSLIEVVRERIAPYNSIFVEMLQPINIIIIPEDELSQDFSLINDLGSYAGHNFNGMDAVRLQLVLNDSLEKNNEKNVSPEWSSISVKTVGDKVNLEVYYIDGDHAIESEDDIGEKRKYPFEENVEGRYPEEVFVRTYEPIPKEDVHGIFKLISNLTMERFDEEYMMKAYVELYIKGIVNGTNDKPDEGLDFNNS